MKIAHITPSFYPAHYYGGPTQSVYQLCRYLAKAEFEVRVLTTDANGPSVLDIGTEAEIERDGFSVAYKKRNAPESISWHLLRSLAEYVRWADVVHITGVYSFPTIPALWTARRFSKPVVWSPRGSLQWWTGTTRVYAKEMWESVCRKVAPPLVALHVTSAVEAAASERRMPGMKAHIVPNGTEIPELSGVRNESGSLQMLYLGRMHPIKGPDRLIEACSQIRHPRWGLTMAGWGEPDYVQELRKDVDQRGLGDRVRIIAAVTGEEKRKLIESSDLVVVPSHSENFSQTVVEALAYSIPVIASTGTPWKDLPAHGCGLWVDNKPETLAGAIDQIAVMPLREMGERGREWVSKEYSWYSVAGEMGRLYRKMVGNV